MLVLYHITTFAPISANACTILQPIPDVEPVTMAVFPRSENRSQIGGASARLSVAWMKFPPWIGLVDILSLVVARYVLRSGTMQREKKIVETQVWENNKVILEWSQFILDYVSIGFYVESEILD
jgi:hypothetical protein